MTPMSAFREFPRAAIYSFLCHPPAPSSCSSSSSCNFSFSFCCSFSSSSNSVAVCLAVAVCLPVPIQVCLPVAFAVSLPVPTSVTLWPPEWFPALWRSRVTCVHLCVSHSNYYYYIMCVLSIIISHRHPLTATKQAFHWAFGEPKSRTVCYVPLVDFFGVHCTHAHCCQFRRKLRWLSEGENRKTVSSTYCG